MLSRERVSQGLVDELERFEALVRPLDQQEWSSGTRCEGWSVADVAAHLIGTMTDIAEGRFDGLGTPEVTQREVEERRGRSPQELADECAKARDAAQSLLAAFDEAAWEGPAPAGIDGTLGAGVEALWYDAYLHADDIRAALGRPSEHGPGLPAAVSHVEDILAGAGWKGAVPDDPAQAHAFVLVATGRAADVAVEPAPPNIYA